MSFAINPTLPFGTENPSLLIDRPSVATQATAPGNAKDPVRDRLNTLLIAWQQKYTERVMVRTDILRFYDDRTNDLDLSDKVRNSLPAEVLDFLGQKENASGNLYTIEEE